MVPPPSNPGFIVIPDIMNRIVDRFEKGSLIVYLGCPNVTPLSVDRSDNLVGRDTFITRTAIAALTAIVTLISVRIIATVSRIIATVSVRGA